MLRGHRRAFSVPESGSPAEGLGGSAGCLLLELCSCQHLLTWDVVHVDLGKDVDLRASRFGVGLFRVNVSARHRLQSATRSVSKHECCHDVIRRYEELHQLAHLGMMPQTSACSSDAIS